MRRWLRIVALGLVALLLVVGLLAAFALGTSTGARLVLDAVAPAELRVGQIRGRLWGPLVLEDVRYQGASAEATVARVTFDWRPMRLLGRRMVDITTLDVDSAHVTLLETAPSETADDDGVGRPSLPVAVRLDGARARWLQVRTAGDTIRAELLAVSAGARSDTLDLDTLRLRDFDLRGSRFQLEAGGRLVSGAVSARDTVGIDVTWSGRLRDSTTLAGRAVVRGASGTIAIDHRLSRPIAARTEARVRDPWLPDSLRWELSTEVPRFAVSELRDGAPGELGLTVRASGGTAAARGRIDARGSYPGAGEVALGLAGALVGDTVAVDTLRLRRLDGPGAVRGGGRVVLSEPGPRADVELAWSGLGWPLDSAAIASPDGTLRFSGRAGDFRGDAELALRQPRRSLGRWTVSAVGGYEDGRLSVRELVARSRAGARLSATADVALDDGPDGRAELRWSDLTWPLAGDTVAISSPDGRLAVEGSAESLTLGGDVSVAGPAIPLAITRVRLDVRASGGPESLRARIDATGRAGEREVLGLVARGDFRTESRVLAVDTLDARLLETGGRVTLSGVADLDDPERRLDLRARWSELAWPLDSARYRSDEGRLDVRSADRRIVASAELQLGGETLPAGRWRIRGQGDRSRFVVDSVRARLLDGELRAAGVVWPDSGAWELEVTADSLAPERWRPDAQEWAGRVGFRVRTAGTVGEDGPRYRATVDTVRGTLRGRPLGGYAAVEGTADRVRIDTLRVRAGESALDAAGSIADTVAVGWRVDARDLGDIMPGAIGRLEARGRVTGPRTAPSVDVTADARAVALGGWSVDSASARVDVPDAGRDRSSVDLVLRGVRSASLALDSVRIAVAGTRSDHEATLGVGAPEDVMETRLAGGLADGRWAGELTRLRLRSRVVGEWRLREPVTLAVGPDSGSIGRVCWVGSGELCATGAWDAAGVRWNASGERLPTALLRPVLPRAVAVRGELELESRGRAAPGLVPTGELRLAGAAGEVDYVPDAGQIVTQSYDSVVVDAVSDSSGIEARLAIRLGAPGRLTATATLPGTAPLADRSITGRLDLHLEDDGAVSRYLPALARSRGTADARIRVAGTVREPQVEGRLELTDVGAVVATAGVRLSEGRLEARSTPDGDWEVEGGILSDTSRLTLTGSARPPAADRDWWVRLRLTGTGVPVYDTPDLLIIASPELGLRASPDSIAVDGRITVPRGRIAIQQLEGDVDVSPDVVIVGADGEAPADSAVTPAAVRGEILLVLGDRVMLDALGLTGRLDGRLTIAALPGRPPVASGELVIHDGRYRIYRQTFDIDQGRLLYASTPLPNPAVDLRITRSRGEVTAGMEVTGRARDPRVRLFSDPALDDEQILAYLIVGRPLRQLNQEQGSRVERMARSVGVAGGNLLLARLGSLFGLETARIERTDPDEEGARTSRLVLGAEILPRVHVDYAIGFGTAVNALRLRYRIAEHWVLQTESGVETGADLLYTINSAGTPLPESLAPDPPSGPPPRPR